MVRLVVAVGFSPVSLLTEKRGRKGRREIRWRGGGENHRALAPCACGALVAVSTKRRRG
jgi:hypothetical protein